MFPSRRHRWLVRPALAMVVLLMTPAATLAQAHLFSRLYGDIANDESRAVARDAEGNILMAGSFTDTIDLGGGPLSSLGLDDMFLAKFDPEGGHLWSRSFGSTSVDRVNGIDVDADGSVYVGGFVGGAVTLAGTTYPALGSLDGFVARFDAAGELQWARIVGGANEDRILDVAAHPDFAVVVSGQFQGAASFGGAGFNFGMGHSMFTALYDDVGGFAWSRAAAPTGPLYSSYGRGVAARESDEIYVTGYATHGVDFGNGPLAVNGASDAFLVHYAADGTLLDAVLLGDSGAEYGNAIDAADDGYLMVAGGFSGTADFGGGPLVSAGGGDVFVARFALNLTHEWSAAYGDTGDQFAVGIDDFDGQVALTGQFVGFPDFGGGALDGGGPDPDAFVALFGAQGEHVWSRGIGAGEAYAYGYDVALAPGSRVWVTGGAQGTVDFGGGELATADGSLDAWLAQYGPADPSGVDDTPTARSFVLGAPRPNPFNPSTRIDFTLLRSGPAELAVYDLAGRKLRVLHAGPLAAGNHGFAWDGRDERGRAAASGVYHFRLTTAAGSEMRKAVLVK